MDGDIWRAEMDSNLNSECCENVEDEDGNSEAEHTEYEVTAVLLASPDTPEFFIKRAGCIFFAYS